jgi:molecular chaperone DnaK (HSP70)
MSLALLLSFLVCVFGGGGTDVSFVEFHMRRRIHVSYEEEDTCGGTDLSFVELKLRYI